MGTCFSPNGRFLYVTHFDNIHQLDLWDSNSTSQWYFVAGHDTADQAFQGYTSVYPGSENNKLYIGNFHGISAQMIVIDSPDNKGISCHFCPRCLQFPPHIVNGNLVYAGVSSPPNMPNYKLGAANSPCTLGITEVQNGSGIKVYPNPANTALIIEYGEAGSFILMDILGRMYKEISLPSGKSRTGVEVSSLSAGVYSYRYQTKKGNQTGKLIIVH
jgi:hypothetical protein